MDNPYKYMKRAAVCVISRWEGLQVLIEAMASGATVVSTDCPSGLRDLEDGRWGRLVPVGDVYVLAGDYETLTRNITRM